MSEIVEVWQAMREHNKKKRAKRLEVTKNIQWPAHRKCSEWHWKFKTYKGIVDYWPTGAKWRFKDRTYTGNPGQLIKFVKKLNGQGLLDG